MPRKALSSGTLDQMQLEEGVNTVVNLKTDIGIYCWPLTNLCESPITSNFNLSTGDMLILTVIT